MRKYALILAGAWTGAGVFACLLTPSRLWVRAPDQADLGGLAAGVPLRREFRIRNLNPLLPVTISSVGTTCGCVEVVSAPDRIGPFGVGVFEVLAKPGSSAESVSSVISISLNGRERIEFTVAGRVEPIVPGWPQVARAVARSDDDGCSLRVSGVYAGKVRQAKVFDDASNRQIESHFTPSTGDFHIQSKPGEDDRWQVVLVFDGEPPLRWAGPLALVSR